MSESLTVCRASAGTGKTYTLAAYYMALLFAGVNYRNILAVTFTNKATAEMKQRIMKYLYNIAEALPNSRTQAFLDAVDIQLVRLGKKPLVRDTRLQAAAQTLYSQILADYENMRVSTIDAFLQSLLKGMTQALGFASGYTVDLDVKHAIGTAVEQILSSNIMDQEGLLEAVSDYIRSQLDAEEKWNIQPQLREVAEQLFREDVQSRRDHINHNKTELNRYRVLLEDNFHNAVADLQNFLQSFHPAEARCRNVRLNESDCDKLKDGLEHLSGGENIFSSFLSAGKRAILSSRDSFADACSGPDVDAEYQAWLQLLSLCEKCRSASNTLRFATLHFNDLMVMCYVQEQIHRNLQENNTILLAETANMLARSIQPGDADFILEKAGIRYNFIILDEFQDTSSLQWRNFLPLIEELLGNGHCSFIVGDAKQSIYRWRNGDWKIISSLDAGHETLHDYVADFPLEKNYRSREEVVRFVIDSFDGMLFSKNPEDKFARQYVNDEMRHIYAAMEKKDDFILSNYYDAENKPGGFVLLRGYPYFQRSGKIVPSERQLFLTQNEVKNRIILDMFTRMNQLLHDGYKPEDMMILIRRKKEITPIVNCFNAHRAEFDRLKDLRIISSDSHVLSASVAVNCLICALRYILNKDEVSLRYLRHNYPDLDMELVDRLDKYMPLYEIVQQIVRLTLCHDGGVYVGNDIAFVNCFMDKLCEYIESYGSDLQGFLAYWDDRLADASVPSVATNGIQIMTIHASKGLEAKNIFIPFCDWKMDDDRGTIWCQASGLPSPADPSSAILPVALNAELAHSEFAGEYTEEHARMHIDVVNLLYVALTRAGNNLFVYCITRGANDLNLAQISNSLLLRWNLNPNDIYHQYTESASAILPEQCYVEQTWGEMKFYPKIEEDKELDPYTFPSGEDQTAFYSENNQIAFVQSQPSQQYSMYGVERGEERIRSMRFGTICHDVLAEVAVRDDVDPVIRKFCHMGIIEDEQMRRQVSEAISHIWLNEQMADWFTDKWTLMREDAVLWPTDEIGMDNRPTGKRIVMEKRMDRVMIQGDTAIVLDYKFGEHPDKKYDEQIRNYMKILRGLGYTDVRGYLWYNNTSALQEVKEIQ